MTYENRELEKKYQKARLLDLENVLKTEHGKRFLGSLIGICNVYSQAKSLEPSELAFFAGERNLGIRLIDDINKIDPEIYPLILRADRELKQTIKHGA